MIKFQGDIVLIETTKPVPSTATQKEPEGGKHIVAHSETGHHHFVNAADAVHFQDADPNVCYLQMLTDSPVIHDRSWDTHAPQMLDAGKCYIGIRQVEKAPEGWRRVAD